MRILVDGDSAGHRDLLLSAAAENGAELVWVCNFSQRPPVPDPALGVRLSVRRVDEGFQAADIELMNLAGPGDLVVTGDLGLASVCVCKGAAALSPRGFWFRTDQLEARMEWRHLASRLRRGGARLEGQPPHTRLDDWRFERELREALAPPQGPV